MLDLVRNPTDRFSGGAAQLTFTGVATLLVLNSKYFKIKFVSIDVAMCGSVHDVVTVYEPRCEKNGLRGFRPGPTQTRLYSHRRCLEA